MEQFSFGKAERDGADSRIEISPEEERFLSEYAVKLDSLVEEISAHRGSEIAGLLKQLLRPDAWRVLLNLGKAERLMSKAWQSPRGQAAFAREAAQEVNREYDRRAAAVVKSLRELTEFVNLASGSSESEKTEEEVSSDG